MFTKGGNVVNILLLADFMLILIFFILNHRITKLERWSNSLMTYITTELLDKQIIYQEGDIDCLKSDVEELKTRLDSHRWWHDTMDDLDDSAKPVPIGIDPLQKRK